MTQTYLDKWQCIVHLDICTLDRDHIHRLHHQTARCSLVELENQIKVQSHLQNSYTRTYLPGKA